MIDFNAVPPAPSPNKMGITVIDSVGLKDVVPYIDWVSLTSHQLEIDIINLFIVK